MSLNCRYKTHHLITLYAQAREFVKPELKKKQQQNLMT